MPGMSVLAAHWDVAPEPDAMAERAASWLVGKALEAAEVFRLCLSGGSTPEALYRKLAAPSFRDRFPWSRTHVFWGDERFVPTDSPLSNYRMARESLLDHVPIAPGAVHPIPTAHDSPAKAADAYERLLKTEYGADSLDPARPLFDVMLLGLGTDGHTASLFPDAKLALAERQRWVVPVIGVKAEPRITLTYPALESSRHVAFLVSGADKAPILARLADGDPALPAARVKPAGDLWIFTDAAARGLHDR
jgi:6-phosphogluconolactonase